MAIFTKSRSQSGCKLVSVVWRWKGPSVSVRFNYGTNNEAPRGDPLFFEKAPPTRGVLLLPVFIMWKNARPRLCSTNRQPVSRNHVCSLTTTQMLMVLHIVTQFCCTYKFWYVLSVRITPGICKISLQNFLLKLFKCVSGNKWDTCHL